MSLKRDVNFFKRFSRPNRHQFASKLKSAIQRVLCTRTQSNWCVAAAAVVVFVQFASRFENTGARYVQI